MNLDRGLVHILSGAEWSGGQSRFVARAVETQRLSKTEAICCGASVADAS